MRLRFRTCLALSGLLWTSAALAQELQAPPSPPPPPAVQPAVQPSTAGYPVAGRVVCADTQRPARFAQVTLVPASTGVGDFDRGRAASGRTDLDGRFLIDGVPPGDYFATAEMTGYINEASAVRSALSQGGDALNALASVPRVQVAAGGGTAQISLQRGGTISGAVQWDDGSPAGGVQVAVQSPPSTTSAQANLQSGPGFGRQGPYAGPGSGGQTDDRGRFRLSGLSPGSYVLRASVQSPMPAGAADQGRFQRLMSLNVYAPNKLRKTEASVITVAAGEERADANIVLALSGMHAVSGQVSSSAAAVRSGSVLLTDQTDTSLSRRGSIGADGSFVVPYVPPGTYTLRVTASSQAAGNGRDGGNGGGQTGPRFQPLQESVTVADGDLTGVNVTVTSAATSP